MVCEMAWSGMTAALRSWVRGVAIGQDAVSSKNIRHQIRVQGYAGSSDQQSFNSVSIGSEHPGGCTVSFADGSTRFLAESVDLNGVLLPMASRSGGENAGDD
jgi:prepilin-type processing-associated H-X9-DG protein